MRSLFFYAPKILGGAGSRPSVGGMNPVSLEDAYQLEEVELRKLGAVLGQLLSGVTPDFAALPPQLAEMLRELQG